MKNLPNLWFRKTSSGDAGVPAMSLFDCVEMIDNGSRRAAKCPLV